MHRLNILQNLIHAQTTDDAWLSYVHGATGTDPKGLTIDSWNKNFDAKNYGTIEEITLPDGQGIQWNRPDGGMPMVAMNTTPEQIILARFLMFANIIGILQKQGELSFAKVGFPENWNRVTIYFNGRKESQVVSADALLGTVEFYMKNEHGKFKVLTGTDEFETVRVSGRVKIVVEEKPHTFF